MQILTRSTQIRMVQVLLLISLVSWNVAAQSAPSKKDIPAIAKAANGAIVSIVMSDKDGKPIAQGSGFFVGKNGDIVTNYHVIAKGSSAVAKLPNGAFYGVGGVGAADKERDVAVIQVYWPAGHYPNFRALRLGNSDRVQVGQEVVAIGNPLSLESTVSNGIVSGIRTIKEEGGKFLQITAPISPGSSGGPLFNMAGEVIGITTAGLKGGENLNFAIPINDGKQLLATANILGVPTQKFPNEQPQETQSETTHQKATLEEQKTCSEQAEKVFDETVQYHSDMVTFDAVGHHYDASIGICFVEISRSDRLPSSLANDKTFEFYTSASDGAQRAFFVYDVFGGNTVGRFIWAFPYEKFSKPWCKIYSGQSEIGCKSEEEFHDLAFKYFGIPK